ECLSLADRLHEEAGFRTAPQCRRPHPLQGLLWEGVVVKGDMAIIAICKHLNGMAGSKGGFILRELDDNTLFCKTSVQDWLRMDVSKELSKLLSLGEDSPADGRSPVVLRRVFTATERA
ncbi:hypothetical protein FOZ62_025795, partial [Perkinsus olseni]